MNLATCTYGCGETFPVDHLVAITGHGNLCPPCLAEYCADTGTDPREFSEPDCTAYYDRGDAA